MMRLWQNTVDFIQYVNSVIIVLPVAPPRLLRVHQHLLDDLAHGQAVLGGGEGDGVDAEAGVGRDDTGR